jgi:hypothetical protein
MMVLCAGVSTVLTGTPTSQDEWGGAGSTGARPLTWAIFTPPKPFHKSSAQYAALRSWLSLRIKPKVTMAGAAPR